MRFREHRGSLADSKKTEIELPDKAALVAHIRTLLEPFGAKWTPTRYALNLTPTTTKSF